MKKAQLFILVTTTLFLSNQSSAQYLISGSKTDSTLPKIEFGVKLGIDLQSLSGTAWEPAYNPGIAGGIFVGMHKHKVGVRVEVLATTATYKSSSSFTDSVGNKGTFRAVYLDVPLLFEYRFAPGFTLLAGPQYGNILSMTTIDGAFGNLKSLFNQSEFSGLIGLEYKLPKRISVGVRYIYGFTNINDEAVTFRIDQWHNSTIQVYAAYSIL